MSRLLSEVTCDAGFVDEEAFAEVRRVCTAPERDEPYELDEWEREPYDFEPKLVDDPFAPPEADEPERNFAALPQPEPFVRDVPEEP